MRFKPMLYARRPLLLAFVLDHLPSTTCWTCLSALNVAWKLYIRTALHGWNCHCYTKLHN